MSVSATYLIRRAVSLPPHVALRKALGLGMRELRHRRHRWQDRSRSSYAEGIEVGPLARRIALAAERIPEALAGVLPGLAHRYLEHRFDLLGSGWTRVHHGMSCAGLEGIRYPPRLAPTVDARGEWLRGRVNDPNLAESQRVWRLIDNEAYTPVDWQIDFKSGYRWSERSWYLDVAIGSHPGADVKVPWELARMQHLPQLALAALAACAHNPDAEDARACAREVRNQILDFVATNPPRFGVNWRCPMELGIRIVNWLVAVDILRAAGLEPDGDFQRVLGRSVLEHAEHIVNNLEWSESGRSNHYLADIVGLLFAAAYLPSSAYSDALLAFAIRELNAEAANQFHADGSSYEGSTSYHRLSAELLVYGAALVAGLAEDRVQGIRQYDRRELAPRSPFPPAPLPVYALRDGSEWLLSPRVAELLPEIGEFTRAVTKPDGQVVQIGDTDSGRLLKLHPVWRVNGADEVLEEDHLDHEHLSCAVAALTGITDSRRAASACLDGFVVASLTNSRCVPSGPGRPRREPPEVALGELLSEIEALPPESRRVRHIPVGEGVTEDLRPVFFPDFGLGILKGSRLFVSLRFGSPEPGAPRSHIHDDSLALELQVDGEDLIVDPGSYLYTAHPELRNEYRSAAAHDAPRVKGKPAVRPTDLLFDLEQCSQSRFLGMSCVGMAAELEGKDWRVRRVVRIQGRILTVADGSWGGELVPLLEPEQLPRVSIGYGKKTERPARAV